MKLLGFIFILSAALSLLNPNGLAGLLYPLNVTKNYGYTIVENQTLFLLESIGFSDPNFLFVKISWAILILSILFVILTLNQVQGKNLIINKSDPSQLAHPADVIVQDDRLKNVLITLFGLTLSLLNVRSFPYLVFLSLPAVLMNFPEFKYRGFVKSLSLVTCFLLLLESFFYLSGTYYKYKDQSVQVGLSFMESPKKAMEFLLEKDLPQPIFNNFDIGSYIIYKTYPEYQVFVDGRPEAYPAEFFQQTYIPIQSDYQKFKEAEKEYGFKTIIFSHTDQTPWGRIFLQNVVKDPDWKTVYIDDFMVILNTSEVVSEKKLTTVDLANLTPTNQYDNHVPYLRMAIFLLNTGNQASANQFLEKAYQLFPNSPVLAGKKSSFFW